MINISVDLLTRSMLWKAALRLLTNEHPHSCLLPLVPKRPQNKDICFVALCACGMVLCIKDVHHPLLRLVCPPLHTQPALLTCVCIHPHMHPLAAAA